ncbi:MAG: ATP-binding protein [Pseudomonadota bacterium]
MTVSASDANVLYLSLSPTPEAVRDAHVRISAWMETRGIDADLRGNTEIVLGEALNNVVEHAFAAWSDTLPEPDAIRLEMRRGETGLSICICDRGDEMPGLALPEGQLPAMSDQTDLLPEGGFGWFLIRELASRLDYYRQNGWNRLDMVIEDTADTAARKPGTG